MSSGTDAQAAAEREAVASLKVIARDAHPYPAERFDGRGIIVCAGGARLFTCAWVCLSVLRRALGCTLPIEVWHLGPAELGPTEAALLAELDVAVVDAHAVRARYPARTLGGWELKPYALANCRFREVLLLDADNIAVRDPAYLFETDAYRRTGALFWPDVSWIRADSAIWDLCGVECRGERAWESGQLVLDKSRCWAPLQLVRHMNDYSEVFYRHLYGDKDTFQIAWRMLDRPYGMTPRASRVMDYGLVQHDLDGEQLFQHRNQAKWALLGENPVDAGFHHGPACLAALTDLAGRWSGRIDVLPERSDEDLRAEAELAAARLFELERLGSDSSLLELLPGNRVGDGRTDAWLRWYVGDGSLVLSGLPGITARLSRDQDGAWSGRSEQRGGHRLALRAVGDAGGDGDPVSAVIAALLHQVAAGGVTKDDAVTTIVTLGSVADIPLVLARERSRWPDGSTAAEAIDSARWRLGRRNPSLRATDGGEARRYAPS